MAPLKLFFTGALAPYLASLMFLITLGSARVYAAPHPAVGSSVLVAPEHGIFWKRWGFQLGAGKTGWQMLSDESGDNSLARYIRPNSATGSLALRTELLKTDLSLKNYTKKWMRDYTNYGFEVLGTNSFFQNGARGLVIDLIHRKSDQQLRQVLFLKNKRVVVLTCRDQQKKFQQTLLGCNEISKTFKWSKLSHAEVF